MAEHLHSGHRERVKKRYIDNGVKAFAPHELVEMLLFFGIPQKDTNPLAHRLMETFGSVRAILNADRAVLLRVEGMTPNAATLLTLVGDLRRYCAEEEMPFGTPLTTINEQVRFFLPRFVDQTSESVWMASLDILSRVSGVHKISQGTAITADINIREVLRHALSDNAVKVILAHNHPSGIAVPSHDDINTTAQLAVTLNGAGIELTDHLIYARNGDCVSFRETASLMSVLRGE